MATKALSNGTLSLRFMQNAQRAKQQTQVQVEQAKIIDDAEWHVSKEVQDLWGAASGPSQSSVKANRFTTLRVWLIRFMAFTTAL
jgi:hypothetical protein